MAHKCFMSFKTEDMEYKKYIQNNLAVDMVDKSLDEPIDSDDEDYIMRVIREQYLSDSTVTVHLIGLKSAEVLGWEEQKFIKRELQASLYDGEGNTRSGILGVVLPSMYDQIYKGVYVCRPCGKTVSSVLVNEDTTISEFHKNYYIDPGKCHHGEDDRYCVLAKWDDFKADPSEYIETASAKRDHYIAEHIIVRPE